MNNKYYESAAMIKHGLITEYLAARYLIQNSKDIIIKKNAVQVKEGVHRYFIEHDYSLQESLAELGLVSNEY